jgi:transposase
VPDPEVSDKALRRQFTAHYKRRMLEELDRCSEPGQGGALLGREGLYSAHLAQWRKQREAGLLPAFAPKKRGHKPANRPQALRVENERLRGENEGLKRRLERAQGIMEFQKKVADLFGLPAQFAQKERPGCPASKNSLPRSVWLGRVRRFKCRTLASTAGKLIKTLLRDPPC